MTDSIINGSLDERQEMLTTLGLRGNPFGKTEPHPDRLDRIFVGRELELKRVGTAVSEHRNVLLAGNYGSGKTTFARKLLSELRASKRLRFVSGFAAVASTTPEGFQLAALTALCEAILDQPWLPEDVRAEAGRTQTELAQLVGHANVRPLPRFAALLKRATTSENDRFVLAIDELDKSDVSSVRGALVGSRPMLDLHEVAFVIAMRPFEAFSDMSSALNAVFDERIDLGLFSAEKCREIIRKNLASARLKENFIDDDAPFSKALVDLLATESRGVPRPLNLMASQALEEALRASAVLPRDRWPNEITREHLEQALRTEGAQLFAQIDAEARVALGRMRAAGDMIPADETMDRGIADSDVLERLAARDAVFSVSSGGKHVFVLAPPVARKLDDLALIRDDLVKLWAAAESATTNEEKGLSLELFAKRFFDEHFRVVDTKLRTDTSELDLVLEPSDRTSIVFRQGPYLRVECKNWRDRPVGQREISQVFGDMAARGLKQAFIVTTGSFTAEAQTQARALFEQREIFLIDRVTIQAFLNGDIRDPGDLLIEQHRVSSLRVRR